MIFMNTLAADFTVNKPDYWIENLHDLLYETKFAHVQPIISKQINMLNALSNSVNATDEKVLYDRMKGDSSNSMFYVGVNPEDSQASISVLDRITKDLLADKRAFIEDSTILFFTM